MKFDLQKQFYKLFGVMAIIEIILVEVIGSPVARPFGESLFLDPVADAQRQKEYGIQEGRSDKRVAFYDDTLTGLLIDAQEDEQHRYKRIGESGR